MYLIMTENYSSAFHNVLIHDWVYKANVNIKFNFIYKMYSYVSLEKADCCEKE